MMEGKVVFSHEKPVCPFQISGFLQSDFLSLTCFHVIWTSAAYMYLRDVVYDIYTYFF